MTTLTDEQLLEIYNAACKPSQSVMAAVHAGLRAVAEAAIAADRAARAEPVAFMREGWGPDCGPFVEFYTADEMGSRDRDGWAALYAAPPAAPVPDGYVLVPAEPTEEQWGGLARDLIMWMDYNSKTPRNLFKHLEMCGREIPQWLRDEPEMQSLDHVPSKGTRAVLVYRAMLAAHEAKRGGK